MKIFKGLDIKNTHLYVFSATFNAKVRNGWGIDAFDNQKEILIESKEMLTLKGVN